MPRRLYVSERPERLFFDDLVRPQPWSTAGYNPAAVSPLDDPDAGIPTSQPATVHRDLGAPWQQMYGTIWDVDANEAPKLRSAPGGRIPRPGNVDYNGTRPAGAPAAFYGALIQPVFAVPAAGYMFDFNVAGGDVNDSFGLAVCFRFDPATGTGFGLTFGAPPGSPVRDFVWFVNWEVDRVIHGLPTFANNDLRVICRDGYQGIFEFGGHVNGAPHPDRQLLETFEVGHDGTAHGVYIWDRDGRYSDGPGDPMEQIQAKYAIGGGTRSFRVYAAPPSTAVRAIVPVGDTLRLVAEGNTPADDQITSMAGNGAEQAFPLDPVLTWDPAELTTIEVEDGSGFRYYQDNDAATRIILPGSLLTFAEETDLPLPTDPETGEPLVPEEPVPDPLPEDWRNFFNEFNTGTHHVEGASIDRRPDAITSDMLTAHSLGPVAISDTADGIISWVWEVWADNETGQVWARRENATRDGWDPAELLFSYTGADANPIRELDVAFNQNGRPEVATERADGNLWHFYFHPVDEVYRFENFGAGRTPRVVLDEPWNIPGSEVMILYLDDAADMMRYRLQSDRYVTTYDTPLRSIQNAFLEEVVRTYGYRIQIQYTVRWPVEGYFACRSFVTALYPIDLTPEGVNFSDFALESMGYVPVEFPATDAEGVDFAPALDAMEYVPPLTPDLEKEGVEFAFDMSGTVISPISPDLEEEGVEFAFALEEGGYVPIINRDLTEGVDFAYALEATYLGP